MIPTTTRSASHSLRGILIAQIEAARRHLLSSRLPSDASIHAARKALTRARATLRLLRPSLVESTYRGANTRLRNVAAALRAARDAKVLLDTVAVLLKSEPDCVRPVFGGLTRLLARERAAAGRALVSDGYGAVCGPQVLRDLASEVRRWPAERADAAYVIAALRRTFKKTRKAMAIARQRRTNATLHESRKQLKYLVFELQLLQPLSPKYLGRRLLTARRLAQLLGLDHDLALLREKIKLKAGGRISRAKLSAFAATLNHRRLAAQKKSDVVGARLFAQTPRHFVQRLDRRSAIAQTLAFSSVRFNAAISQK